MATLRDLSENVRPLVAAAPTAAVVWAYARAAREFFSKTLAWSLDLELPTTTDASYVLNPGTDLEVFDAVECWYGADCKLKKATAAQIKRAIGPTPAARQPQYFNASTVNTLVVAPAPAAGGETLYLQARVRPTLTAAELDDDMVAKYGDTLECGVLAYLFRMPRRPWTDYEAAREYDGKFQSEIITQSVIGPDGGVGTPRRVKYGGL